MLATLLLTLVASVLIATSTLHFANTGITSTRLFAGHRRRRMADLVSLRQAAEIARLNSELHAPDHRMALDWRVMEVEEVVDESDDCRSFYLVDPYRQPLPSFRPGQYLMVRPAMAGAYQTTRCYSLSSSPNDRYWRITVKRQASETNLKPTQHGGLSDWLHRTINEGDCLLIGGPNGQFYLPPEQSGPVVLLAAGVGITPMASMMRWSLEHTPDRPVHLHYQAKDLDHWPLGSVLHAWKSDFPKCHVTSYFSRVQQEDLSDEAAVLPGQLVAGRMEVNDIAEHVDREQTHFYLCGPDAWMQSVREALVQRGIQQEHIHWESFGPSSATDSDVSEVVTGHSVRFASSQQETTWDDPEQSLWDLASSQGIEIPSGCHSGVCGCCRARLLDGEVAYDRPVLAELEEDQCLTCVARPTTAITLDI